MTAGLTAVIRGKSCLREAHEALAEKTKGLKIGNALDYQTEFGPVISKEQQQKALRYTEEAVGQGAKLSCGGKFLM